MAVKYLKNCIKLQHLSKLYLDTIHHKICISTKNIYWFQISVFVTCIFDYK